MRKTALILFVCGLSLLVVGSALAIPSVRSKLLVVTIPSYGTIGHRDDSSSQATEASLPQQTSDRIGLDTLGYFTILASVGFFATGFVISRKRA